LADDGRGTFYPSGYEWQRVMCVPASDLIIVRLGKTLEADYEVPEAWMKTLIATFDPPCLTGFVNVSSPIWDSKRSQNRVRKDGNGREGCGWGSVAFHDYDGAVGVMNQLQGRTAE